MTREDAVFLFESKFWEPLSARERATFQLFQERLCMPFDVFQKAMVECLGRPVWTHEFTSSNQPALQAEFLGERQAPTVEEIFALIPADKRIMVKL